MPEGDVVFRAAQRLHRALAGQPLVGAELHWGELSGAALLGRTTLEVVSRGKHLLHRIDDGTTVHSHLRMEGTWRVKATRDVRPTTIRSPDLRAAFATTEWTALGWKLGMLDLVPTREEDSVVGHLGPDLLGSNWDEQLAVQRLRRDHESPLGAALLDQRNLAGIGTIYAAESLFMQRLNPWRPVGDIDQEQLLALVRRAQRLLTIGAERGRPDTTGDPREPTYAHGRSGRPCRRCGEPVRVAMIGTAPRDRTMFYCARCQGGLAPGDDGRRQRPLGAR